MNKQNVLQIAAHDRERSKHMEPLKKRFLRNPPAFRRKVQNALDYLDDIASVEFSTARLGARMAIFGFHILFEEMARWEDGDENQQEGGEESRDKNSESQ